MKRSDKKFVWLFFLFPMAKIPHLYSGCQVFRGLFSEKVYWCSQMVYVLFGGKNTILKMRSQVFEGLFWSTKILCARNLVKRCLNLLIMPSSLVKLMELSNHSNVAITKRYLGLKQEEILQIYDCLIFCFFITINWQKRKTNCKNSSSRIRNVWRRIRKSWWSVKAFFYFAKAKIFFAKANLKCW